MRSKPDKKRKVQGAKTAKTRPTNPFTAAASSLSFVLQSSPATAIGLSAMMIGVYGLAVFGIFSLSRNTSIDQLLATLYIIIICLGLFVLQAYGWLLSILLVRRSRQKKKIKLRVLVSGSTKYIEPYFALQFLELFIVATLSLIVIKISDLFASGLLTGLTFAIGGFLLIGLLPRIALIIHVMIYENRGLVASIKRGALMGRNRTVELIGSLSAQFLMFGISLVALVGSVGSVDERYNYYVMLEHAGEKSKAKTHIINWLFTIFWLMLCCVVGIAISQRNPSNAPAAPLIEQHQTENYCYLDEEQKGYTCSQNKEDCLAITTCKDSIEMRSDLDQLIDGNMFSD